MVNAEKSSPGYIYGFLKLKVKTNIITDFKSNLRTSLRKLGVCVKNK